jgi:hypothetical protein
MSDRVRVQRIDTRSVEAGDQACAAGFVDSRANFILETAVVVYGFTTSDPGSQTLFGAVRHSSGIEIPGPESDFFAVKEAPQGAHTWMVWRKYPADFAPRLFR